MSWRCGRKSDTIVRLAFAHTIRLFAAMSFASACASSPPSVNRLAALPDGVMRGTFTDDYGNTYSISDTLFTQQPHGKFEIMEWHTQAQFVVARNAATNTSDPGLWTRIDWMLLPNMSPYTWAFCFTAYRAPTRDAARNTPAADRNNPRTGCNGYPFSRMKPAS